MIDPRDEEIATLKARVEWLEGRQARTIEFQVPMELNETAFDAVREQLDGPDPRGITVVASPSNAKALRELEDKFKCVAVEVPAGVLQGPYAWAIVCRSGKVWNRSRNW